MRCGEMKCHGINSQYQLKNTSFFTINGLMVPHAQTTHCIKSTVLRFYEWNKVDLTPKIIDRH